MLYDGNKLYYPTICIGKNIETPAGVIKSLCISSSGRIVIVEQDPISTGESEHEFISRLSAQSTYLRSLDLKSLDTICEGYFYRTEGQAFRVIDRMAKVGLQTYADTSLFSLKVSTGLQKAQHLVIIATPDSPKSRSKSIMENCAFSSSDLLFSVVASGRQNAFLE